MALQQKKSNLKSSRYTPTEKKNLNGFNYAILSPIRSQATVCTLTSKLLDARGRAAWQLIGARAVWRARASIASAPAIEQVSAVSARTCGAPLL